MVARIVVCARVIVLMLVVDSLRADAPGFGGGEALTPGLDALARGGTLYEEAICSAGWTVPSLTAIATGTFPHRVGVARWRHPFPARRPTLFTAFAAAGFEVHSFFHNPRWAFANTQARGTVGDSQDAEAVCAALRAPSGADRLVFVHHWWTHLPYRTEAIPRAPWRALCSEILGQLAQDPDSQRPRWRRAYLDTVEYLDSELLPRYLDAAHSGGDDVLLCVTADHGENWGESVPVGHEVGHIYDLHGRWLTDDTTRVPLVFAGGRRTDPVPAGHRLSGYARGVDFAPTLCDLAGVPWPGPLSTAQGCTLIDRGVNEHTLRLDGESLAVGLRLGVGTDRDAAMTVTSNNAIVPAKYPRGAARMWRRYSVRSRSGRYVWDGVDRTRHEQDGAGRLVSMGLGSRLRSALSPGRGAWTEMRAARRQAVGPGAMVDKDQFPGLGDEDTGLDEAAAGLERDEDLEASMRMLGYME